MTATHTQTAHSPRWWPELLLLLGGLWFRLQQLARMPLYPDEAFHIEHLRHALNGRLFSAFPFARWLNVVGLVPFQPGALETPWLTRAVSVLLGVLAAVAALWLARRLAGVTAGRLALFVYTVLPFAVFYDRQTMSDTWQAAFGALALVFIVASVTQRRAWVWPAVAAGVLLALSTLSKFAGLLLWPLPLAAAVMLPALVTPRTWRARLWALGPAVVSTCVAVAIFGGVYLLARQSGELAGGGAGFDLYRWCHTPGCATGQFRIAEFGPLIVANLRLYWESVIGFYTLRLWLVFVASLGLAWLWPRQRWLILWLWLPGFLLVVPYIIINDLFPPRYYTFTLAPFSALVAVVLVALAGWLRERTARWSLPVQRVVQWGVVGWLVLAAPVLSGLLVWDVFRAPIPAFEWSQYAIGWPAGLTSRAFLEDIAATHAATGRRVNVVVTGDTYGTLMSSWLWRYGTTTPYSGEPSQNAEVASWLLSGDPLYLVDDAPLHELPPDALGLERELVRTFDMPGSAAWPAVYSEAGTTARLWRVVGTGPEQTRWIYQRLVGDPTGNASAYTEMLALVPPHEPLRLWPPHQLDAIGDLSGRDVRALHATWPIDAARVDGIVAADTATTADTLWVLYWLDGVADNDRLVERAVNARHFFVEERWIGDLRLVRYLTGATPGGPETAQPNATFGGFARLTEAALLDTTVAPGGLVRMRLQWQPLTSTAQDLRVFVHVVASDGALVAQRDAVPMNGVAPTPGWQPDVPITDQFVVWVPPDVAPGPYTVRVGLYDATTGQRLTTDTGQDSLPVHRLSVAP